MTEPPIDPREAAALMIAQFAESMTGVLELLISKDHVSAAHVQARLEGALIAAPATRQELAHNQMLQHVLLRLSLLAPRSSRA